jgi:SlyX protein
MSSDDRLTDIEVRLMHQEAAIDEFSLASHRQQLQLDGILEELKQIRQLLRQLAPGQVGPGTDEPPPPHY